LSKVEDVALQISQREGVMSLPIERLPRVLPRRFPVGATYVVEGYGAQEGDLQVIARYVVLPGGRRINVPAELSRPAAPPRVRAFRRNGNPKQSQAKSRPERGGKKIAARRGTR
jgi:hypothetical protein